MFGADIVNLKVMDSRAARSLSQSRSLDIRKRGFAASCNPFSPQRFASDDFWCGSARGWALTPRRL